MNPGEEARRKLVDAPADLRLATLFAPAAQRHALTALFAVYVEIREIQRECSDRGVASAKLGWWEEEIDALYAGHPRHPLTRQLTPFVPRLAAQHDCFHAIIAGVQMDVSAAGCASFEDVKRQCYRHAGALAELTVALNGAASTEAFQAARLLGNAWRLAEIVTGGIAQALHGHMYFAADDLHRHGVDLHITGGAHSNAGVSALLADYAR
ncbi:MAG: squalene/phytoene synthase family protein, partial [Gammaproteobacteria bacterium]|nr:squalene/phytoene synthase family protein [Gammaproteobacteria bacterium]